jgi:hypothetical protein
LEDTVKKLLIIGLLFFVSLSAEQMSHADSLKLQLKIINAEIELQKRKSESAEDTRDRLDDVVDSLADETEELQDSLEDKLEEQGNALEKISKKINNYSGTGFGGAGGSYFGLKIVNISPYKEAIDRDLLIGGGDSPFYGLGFENKIDGDYEPFFVIGGQGVGGVGSGIRIGGGGYGGERTFNTTLVDSAGEHRYELKLDMGYGGFILEKAFESKKGSIIIGTLLGAGTHKISLAESSKEGNSGGFDDWDDEDSDTILNGKARFFAGDIHASFNYSILQWLHLGVDGTALLFASSGGFDDSHGFATFNPGVGARVMFGNLN